MRADELVLGIDGGGATTVAWLASRRAGEPPAGCGWAGPSNPQTVGFDKACEHLERAVESAFLAARIKRGPVSAACAAIAGVAKEVDRRPIERWAEQRRLARRFVLTHDAQPLLAAGTPQGWGIALVAGACSFAYGRNMKGRSARVGGWGPWIGDEGSGHALGVAALRAVVRAEDGRGIPTRLTEAVLTRLSLTCAADLAPALAGADSDQVGLVRLSELAPIVLDLAEDGDAAACEILQGASGHLAELVRVLVGKLGLTPAEFPLAISGGALLQGSFFQQRLIEQLAANGLTPAPMTAAPDPVAGAVKIARAEAQA